MVFAVMNVNQINHPFRTGEKGEIKKLTSYRPGQIFLAGE